MSDEEQKKNERYKKYSEQKKEEKEEQFESSKWRDIRQYVTLQVLMQLV